jgi:uncharacterized membrane protein YkvA (DUF1232 family)
MKRPENVEQYESHYSEAKFGAKLPRVARKAGSKLVYCLLLLYYVLKSPSVSRGDKSKIYGALGYFILPLDLLPDFIPMAGYADDLSAVLWALHTVWKNITPEIKAQAAAKTREWFGDFDQKAVEEQIVK